MSAEIVHAFSAEAHRLDAEADNVSAQDEGNPAVLVKRELAQAFRNIAQRAQGNDPAQVAAAEAAGAAEGAGGLSVDKTDSETGEPV